ncbi:MAG TPA: hypothetical protein VHC96_05890 [Puia sp.]|nr:hypothetical protein [Puia sp.]
MFSSHEVVQEKRTSLDLSPDDSLCFKKGFDLRFDIRLIPGRSIYFGYIVRLISAGGQNIDLIYNQPLRLFKVIIGETFSGISFSVDSIQLHKEWNQFVFKCNLEDHVLQFTVNGKNIGSSPLPAGIDNCFKILWGANDYQKFKTRDIPPMRIRDIKIFEKGSLKYFWPLDETSGDLAYDKVNQRVAKIKNPVWIKPKFQKWELISSFTLNGYGAVTYDPKHDNIYVAGSDSLAICSLKMDQHNTDYIPCRHQEFILGHQTLYDTFRDKLYDIFVDKKLIMTFDFSHHAWDITMPYAFITEYWHANKFISPVDSSLYMIGGYGQLRYKNRVIRYDFTTHKWDSIHTTGDYFPPRYLSALGLSPDGKYAYVAGGYGSQTGDQMLDPRNYYDLYRYDIKNSSFRKLYTLKTQSTPFTFANNLVIGPKAGAWYGLIYANDSYNSNLQLVEGSFADSAYVPEGDAIPYSFHDVQSFADLYYSPISNKLIAVTLLYSKEETKEKVTQVKIYTLNFPPERAEVAQAAPVGGGHVNYWYVILPLLVVGGAAVWVMRRRRKAALAAGRGTVAGREAVAGAGAVARGETIAGGGPFAGRGTVTGAGTVAGREGMPAEPGAGLVVHAEPLEKNIYPGVYLFGAFQVFDKEGGDITRLFTPLLKELFLIILTYTIRNGRGISSEGLNEILWHDKSEKDAKNNRSVNLAKLKAILERVGNTVINKESGYWQFQTPEEDVYVDYKKYVLLLQGAPDATRTDIRPLVNIIKRGAFLAQTEYNWLDDIKSEVSNAVIDRCLEYIRSHPAGDPEFTIEIANCIFCFDPLNEDALIYKCKSLIQLRRHTLANNTYQKFLKEYKDIYGADFGKTFQEIIA